MWLDFNNNIIVILIIIIIIIITIIKITIIIAKTEIQFRPSKTLYEKVNLVKTSHIHKIINFYNYNFLKNK